MGLGQSSDKSQNQPQQQQQPRQSLTTNVDFKTLLWSVEDEFQVQLVQVQSLREGKVDISSVERLYDLTRGIQKQITDFNWQLYKHHRFPIRPPGSDRDNISKMQTKTDELRSKIHLLESEKQQLAECLKASKGQRDEAAGRQQLARTQDSKDDSVRELRQQAEHIQQLQNKCSTLEALIDSHKSYQTSMENTIKQQEKDIKQLSDDNEALKLRLSKVAGQKLMENNPAIADLSDPNRPTKLGEMYSEIYDNEWTDAFEKLQHAGYEDKKCIETLKLTLLNTFHFCQKKSKKLLEKTEEAVDFLFEEYKEATVAKAPLHLTMPILSRPASAEGRQREQRFVDNKSCFILQHNWKPPRSNAESAVDQERLGTPDAQMVIGQTKDEMKIQIKAFRKEIAESMVPLVQKAYMAASWDAECIPALKPYIQKCLLLGWMMVVQSPPLVLETCEQGSSLNKDKYKEYTRSGPNVEFVVWPAILLHEGGPVIGKGVAQGQK